MNKSIVVTMVLALVAVACRSMPAALMRRRHYIVSAEPIRLHFGNGALCVAIDPADATGAWWWGPGRAGCSTRNTGPGPGLEHAKGLAALFHATDASVVSRNEGRTTEARFRLPIHGEPHFVDVDLLVQGGQMFSVPTGAQVSTRRTDNLDIPLLAPY